MGSKSWQNKGESKQKIDDPNDKWYYTKDTKKGNIAIAQQIDIDYGEDVK